MMRLVQPRELLLLAAAASVPLSLALTAWPPAATQETIVVREIVPVMECCEGTSEVAECESVSEPEPVSELEPVPEPELEPKADFLWITHGHDDLGAGPVIVLSTEPSEAWASGPAQAVDADGVAIRPLDEEALPAELRAMIGQRLETITGEGRVCSAVIGLPRLVAEVDGDLEMLLEWSGDEEPEHEPYYYERPEDERRVELAPAVWEQGRRLLVAALSIEPGCAAGWELRWARSPSHGTATKLQASAPGRPRASVARSFLARPELVELAGELEEYTESMRNEHARRAEQVEATEDSEATEPAIAVPSPHLRDYLQAQRWRADGELAAVTVATEGDQFSLEGCGNFFGPRWGIAAVGADGTPGPVHVGPYGDVVSVLDLEGDGQLEVLVGGTWDGNTRLLTLTPTGLQERSVLPATPSFGCPC